MLEVFIAKTSQFIFVFVKIMGSVFIFFYRFYRNQPYVKVASSLTLHADVRHFNVQFFVSINIFFCNSATVLTEDFTLRRHAPVYGFSIDMNLLTLKLIECCNVICYEFITINMKYQQKFDSMTQKRRFTLTAPVFAMYKFLLNR